MLGFLIVPISVSMVTFVLEQYIIEAAQHAPLPHLLIDLLKLYHIPLFSIIIQAIVTCSCKQKGRQRRGVLTVISKLYSQDLPLVGGDGAEV